MKKWTHISIEEGKWVKRWYQQSEKDLRTQKDPECVGSISMPLEWARKAGL